MAPFMEGSYFQGIDKHYNQYLSFGTCSNCFAQSSEATDKEQKSFNKSLKKQIYQESHTCHPEEEYNTHIIYDHKKYFEWIKTFVFDVYGIDEDNLCSKKRDVNYVSLRHIFIKIARDNTNASNIEIAQSINRDHATVTFALKEFDSKYNHWPKKHKSLHNKSFKDVYDDINNQKPLLV